MMDSRTEELVATAFADRARLKDEGVRRAVLDTIAALDRGEVRVAEKKEGVWKVNAWVMQAVNLYFGVAGFETHDFGPFQTRDKIPLKKDLEAAGVRAVPGAVARYGSYVAPGAVLMPSFVNIGARVGAGTMIDTWATVGSCAQIGRNVHISGGAGIGGVLEPLQAGPVIIEDGCFIGARAEVAEGVIVERGSVLSMGVFLGASTKIVDRASGEVHYGRVPEYSVVVPGTLPGKNGGPALACAVIVKRVDERTRSKTSINELL